MESAQDKSDSSSVAFSTQRGELRLNDRGTFESLVSVNNTMQACETNRTVGQQTHTNSLKRRRSLPLCRAKESDPNPHFLQGIALDKCTNLLSLPDPPSPPKRFSKRRATDTFVPLRDLSNGDEKGIPASPISNSSRMSKRSGGSLTTQNHHSRPKRSRLNLPSMASPLVSKKSAAASAAKNRARDDSAVHRMGKTHTITPPLYASPQNGEGQHSHSTSHTQTAGKNSFQAFKKAPKKAAPVVYQIPTQPDTESLMKIRALVHAYTALPVEKRFESDEAKAIEAASGYPVVPSFVPPHAVRKEDRLDRRNYIITNLPTRMKNVDGCKARDAHLMETVTQCRVQKLRGGYVEYQHIPTGRSVPPQEFEARYMCMINEVSAVRQKSWGDYFAKLTQEIKAHKTDESTKQEENSQSSNFSLSSPPTDAMDDSSQEDKASAIPEASSDDVGKEEGDSMEGIQATEAGDSVTHEPEGENLCAEVIYKTIDEETQRSTPDTKLPRAPSPTSADMLLPFPSRDQPSSNVLIARAEQELWTTIDTALATYSQRVLEIQAAETRTTK